MAGSTGTTRGLALLATVATALVAAGGAGAVLAPVTGVPAGGVWLLGGWLVLAAAAAWCAEAAVARVRRGRQSTRQGETRTLHLYTTGILATALVAELTLITARLTRAQEFATAWAAGALLVALAGAASWHTVRVSERYGSANGYIPPDEIRTIAAFVLAEACGAWLTARFATEGSLWAAWALGAAMAALAAGFWLSDSPDWAAEDRYLKVFGAAAILGVGGVVARFALRGETVAAWWAGGVAVGGPLLVIGVSYLADAVRRRPVGHRGRTASPGAQFAGILVPLGSLAWAMAQGEPWSGADSGERLLRSGWLAGAGAVLLVAQYAVLLWTGTGQPGAWTADLARWARWRVEEETGPAGRSGPRPRAHDGDGLDWEQALEREREWERERRQWEGERERERERAEERLLRELDSPRGSAPTWWRRLARPLHSAAVTEFHRRTALTTGLAIDEIWPRIALVAPDEFVRQVRRGERGVLVWRITIAAALCTSGTWLLIALTGLGGFRYTDWRPVLLVWGPLLLAAIALVQARRLLAEVYEAKANAVEIYRYDLAKRLHITLPPDPSRPLMIRLAAELSGERPPNRSARHRPEEPVLPEGARLDELAALVALRVRGGIRTEVRQALREENTSQALGFPAVTAAQIDVSALAQAVARRVAGPVGEGLKDDLKKHLTALHRQFERDVRAAIHSSVKESATGPALSNFVGYLAIELDRGQQDVRAEGGTVTAPAGQRVKLFVSVVRDPRARDLPSVVESPPGRDFFVFEPVRVEGGRDTRAVSFDAMADSSTLTPLPQRRNLLVENEQQTAFEFRLPEEEGGHEVWLQLYQAGHLVQVVALKVEVRAPAGATGEA